MSRLVILIVFFFCNTGLAQQNLSFYFLHDVPHANFLNPAVKSTCKWYMGIPVISSTHFNYGNSAGNARDFMQFADLDQDRFFRNIPRRPHLTSEFHLNWISFGFQRKDVYWSFAITDKLDIAVFAPKTLMEIVLKGNRSFEGEKANFSGLSAFADYRREYMFGWAKTTSSGVDIGFHGKLLFGKANVSTTKSRNSIYTDPGVFDLNMQSVLKFNLSSPLTLTIDQNGIVRDADVNSSTSSIILNRKNLGLAFDAGFIKETSNGSTLAGSILDLGFIYYRTNPYNYSHSGEYLYDGPLGDPLLYKRYSEDVYSEATKDLNAVWKQNNYVSFLSPRLYLGVQNYLSERLAWSLTGTAKIYRFKIIPGISAGLEGNVNKSIVCTASFSYLNRSFKNIGLGIVLGNSPVQFYMISDNVLGLIYPLRYRTLNLRTGLLLKFGCNNRKKQKDICGCEWLKQAEDVNQRIKQLMH